jgi:hypothetical protein
VDDGLRRIKSLFHINDSGQDFPRNLDPLDGIFRLSPRFGHDRNNRFALPAGNVNGDRVLRRGAQALHVLQHAGIWFRYRSNVFARGNVKDARHACRRTAVDSDDSGMCVWGSQKCSMPHARQLEVVQEAAASFSMSPRIWVHHRASDPAVHAGEFLGFDSFSFVQGNNFSARFLAAISTESTMA